MQLRRQTVPANVLPAGSAVRSLPQKSIAKPTLAIRQPTQTESLFMDQVSAQMLLLKCHGDEIWPEDVCLAEGIPPIWIDELIEQYESGFDNNRNTIYLEGKVTNQFRGVSDLLLAYRLADYIGIDWQSVTGHLLSRTQKVNALKEALDEI